MEDDDDIFAELDAMFAPEVVHAQNVNQSELENLESDSPPLKRQKLLKSPTKFNNISPCLGHQQTQNKLNQLNKGSSTKVQQQQLRTDPSSYRFHRLNIPLPHEDNSWLFSPNLGIGPGLVLDLIFSFIPWKDLVKTISQLNRFGYHQVFLRRDLSANLWRNAFRSHFQRRWERRRLEVNNQENHNQKNHKNQNEQDILNDPPDMVTVRIPVVIGCATHVKKFKGIPGFSNNSSSNQAANNPNTLDSIISVTNGSKGLNGSKELSEISSNGGQNRYDTIKYRSVTIPKEIKDYLLKSQEQRAQTYMKQTRQALNDQFESNSNFNLSDSLNFQTGSESKPKSPNNIKSPTTEYLSITSDKNLHPLWFLCFRSLYITQRQQQDSAAKLNSTVDKQLDSKDVVEDWADFQALIGAGLAQGSPRETVTPQTVRTTSRTSTSNQNSSASLNLRLLLAPGRPDPRRFDQNLIPRSTRHANSVQGPGVIRLPPRINPILNRSRTNTLNAQQTVTQQQQQQSNPNVLIDPDTLIFNFQESCAKRLSQTQSTESNNSESDSKLKKIQKAHETAVGINKYNRAKNFGQQQATTVTIAKPGDPLYCPLNTTTKDKRHKFRLLCKYSKDELRALTGTNSIGLTVLGCFYCGYAHKCYDRQECEFSVVGMEDSFVCCVTGDTKQKIVLAEGSTSDVGGGPQPVNMPLQTEQSKSSDRDLSLSNLSDAQNLNLESLIEFHNKLMNDKDSQTKQQLQQQVSPKAQLAKTISKDEVDSKIISQLKISEERSLKRLRNDHSDTVTTSIMSKKGASKGITQKGNRNVDIANKNSKGSGQESLQSAQQQAESQSQANTKSISMTNNNVTESEGPSKSNSNRARGGASGILLQNQPHKSTKDDEDEDMKEFALLQSLVSSGIMGQDEEKKRQSQNGSRNNVSGIKNDIDSDDLIQLDNCCQLKQHLNSDNDIINDDIINDDNDLDQDVLNPTKEDFLGDDGEPIPLDVWDLPACYERGYNMSDREAKKRGFI